MNYLRYVLHRAAVAVASVYLAVVATYLLGRFTIGNEIRNQLAAARREGASPAELERLQETLRAQYGLDEPLLDRLVGWIADVTTLQWGESVTYREPVLSVLDGRVATTLEYVLPGIALAALLGVLLGLAAALARDGPFDWSVRLTAYALLGVPVFVLLTYATHFAGWQIRLVDGWVLVLAAPDDKTLAAVAVALGLLAGVLRFSRAAALEQSRQSFVKMLRAKGATRLHLARHVLRNAAIPIVSISITELLAVLVLNIYVVEEVLGLPGLAGASLEAATSADVPLLIWSTMVVVALGIALSFLQDLLYGYLDPRVTEG
jgi:peptide/nickel transport system permease protein